MIINAGIKRVICRLNHHDKEGIKLLEKAKVKVEIEK
jgi:deoxycytidylate deaminase